MKISRDRFEEILSAYLDAEASPEELDLLAKCVKEDATMASLYYKSCRVHYATCKMFGKKPVFIKLDGVDLPDFEPKKISRVKIALEWSAVVALMFLSVSLLYVAFDSLPKEDNSFAKKLVSNKALNVRHLKSEVSAHSIVDDGSVFSVIKVYSETPIFMNSKK